VPSHKLVRCASKLDHAASDIAKEFAAEYGLKAEERRQCIRSVRIVRMGQRNLSQRIQRQWPWNGQRTQEEFMDWLKAELHRIDDHSSESGE